MLNVVRRMPRYALVTGMLFVVLILAYSTIYVIEKPGGIADWRLSKAMGLTETLRIPLERTSEEAIRQFRGSSIEETYKIIYQKPVHEGVLQFSKQRLFQGGTDLKVDMARKSWLGWKWASGGGYAIGGTKMDASSDSALSYMMMPIRLEKPRGTFLLFGEIGDTSITHIVVKGDETGAREYEAEIVKTDEGYVVWYIVLPASVSVPFELQAYTDQNDLRATLMITNERENGSIGRSSIH
ncbi:hypothetical protein PAECIP111891_02823 [Paenibacillus allorhizoplanae]|uniref:Uncharacterized protein n=1 Tax=Paenibacillus allorhizoplanae TaxID=2905648 RepID=A0ABN8GDA6_9BACL|nr:hypothetical protein [Paenibacillus allorhizoplanae]CAH1206198.1 hypothetical protein PAECIP111891_02823 [Paenibacillus allorhizoplanae]